MKNIFLIGFMGCGKSTIAEMLAQKLGAECIEMDEQIVEEQGMPITEIFERGGEEYFREIETDLIRRLCAQKNMIVSCGGGAVLREENRRLMKETGVIVWLTAEPETIFARVKHSKNRPVLNGHMNIAYITELMEQRQSCYEEAADFSVKTDGRSREEICEEIILSAKGSNLQG